MLLYIISFLALSSSILGKIVICIGQDGHTAISLNIHKQCCNTDQNAPPKVSSKRLAQLFTTEECAPCVDIPVSVVGESRQVQAASTIGSLSQQVSSATISAQDFSRQYPASHPDNHLGLTIQNSLAETTRIVVLLI
jgi:hypothetical protein